MCVQPASEEKRYTAIARLAEQVEITLRVAAVFLSDQAADAHRMLNRGGVRGHIVLAF